MKLEIGAGSNPQPGYIHHDLRPLDDIEVVCDARQFPDEHKGRYDEVYASNILEHFNRFEIDAVFAEWISLLKPGGTMKIIVPDVKEICRQWVNDFIDHKHFVYLCYGGNDYDGNRHYYGFDTESLAQLFEKHGLEILTMKPGIPWEERKRDIYCPMVVATGRKP